MEGRNIQKYGRSSGKHGSCTFYKAFKYAKNGKSKIITLGQFFFMKILKGIPICIAELQLVWEDKNSSQDLVSVRLYFLPECTPEGRLANHGEDEVLAYSEKVVLKLDDLAALIVYDVSWNDGRRAFATDKLLDHHDHQDLAEAFKKNSFGLDNSSAEQKETSGTDTPVVQDSSPHIMIMGYDRYCRYRCMMKRLENCADKWLRNAIVCALGGFSGDQENNRVYFCRDTFEHSDLDDFELRCDHLAPNLKGRPLKRKGSTQGNDSSEESSCGSSFSSVQKAVANKIRMGARDTPLRNGFRVDKGKVSKDEQTFLIDLHRFMKGRNTPIGRIPSLGFKQIDLYQFYMLAEEIGGYEQISIKRMWKHLYDKLGGNPGFTSAATCTRRHYEKLLLPYERYKMGSTNRLSYFKKKKIKNEQTEPHNRPQDENKPHGEQKPQMIKMESNIKEEVTVDSKPSLLPKGQVNGSKILQPNYDRVDRALIIKQEIAKMKMRKESQHQKDRETFGDREKLWDDRRKYKFGDKVRKPSGGQKTVRELLDKNGKDVSDSSGKMGTEHAGDQSKQEQLLHSIDHKTHPYHYSHHNSFNEKDTVKHHKTSPDSKVSHSQFLPGSITPADSHSHQQQPLFSPLHQSRPPMFYPHLIPMGGAIPGVTPMAMPFMIPQYGIQTVPNPIQTVQSPNPATSHMSKENKSLHALNKLVTDQRELKNIAISMDKCAIPQSSSKHHRSSNISPPSAHPTNLGHAHKGLTSPQTLGPAHRGLTSPQTSAPYQRPITPAHSNSVKRQYSYNDSSMSKSLPNYGATFPENSVKSAVSSESDLKRQKISSPQNVFNSSQSQLEMPVLDFSMKTLRAQEAKQDRGESLLFNASFNKENNKNVLKSPSYDMPQDLSLKSVSKPHDLSPVGPSFHRNVPLKVPQPQLDMKGLKGSNSNIPRMELKQDEKTDISLGSTGFKSPPIGGVSSSMGMPSIGGFPIDLGPFVHPAFPQQMLMQGVFPTPLQLQQMIQGQVAAGMPLLRPEFVPNPLMFQPTFSSVPPTFSTVPPSIAKPSNGTGGGGKR